MTTETVANVKNGVNVDNLIATINAVQENPSLANFEFRAKNNWITGGNCVSSVKNFYGVGEENTSRDEAFTLEAGHPEVLLGENKGATPPEIVLHALASCLTGAIAYHAAAHGIEIEGMESTIDGDMDLHGFLGLNQDARKGFNGINFKLKVKSDATDEQLRELSKFSPVYDIVSNPTPIKIEFER